MISRRLETMNEKRTYALLCADDLRDALSIFGSYEVIVEHDSYNYSIIVLPSKECPIITDSCIERAMPILKAYQTMYNYINYRMVIYRKEKDGKVIVLPALVLIMI